MGPNSSAAFTCREAFTGSINNLSSRFPGLQINAPPRLLTQSCNDISAELLPVYSDRIAWDFHPIPFSPTLQLGT